MADELQAVLDGISSETQPSGTSITAAPVDEIALDLEALFGKEEGDRSLDGPKKEAQDTDPFNLKQRAPQDVEVILRRLQSEKDKERAARERLEKENQQYKPVVDFMTSLYEDQTLKEAFIAELAPDLVKAKDPLTFVKESLKKEFGDDFTPSDDPRDINTMLYNERLRELYAEFKAKSKASPATLSSLRDQRKKERDAANLSAMAEKKEIMDKRNWSEDDWNNFVSWAGKIKLNHLAQIRDTITKKSSPKAPYLAGQSGSAPITPNKIKTELDFFFGPTRKI